MNTAKRILFALVFVAALATPKLSHAGQVDCTPTFLGAKECYVSVSATTTNTEIDVPFVGCGMFVNADTSNDARVSFVTGAITGSTGVLLPHGERLSQCLRPSNVFSVIMPSNTATVRFFAWGN